MQIPPPQNGLVTLIDKRHAEAADRRPRPHMGASQLGHPCDRWLWLSFRWAVTEEHEGRMLRLFRRGQSEEATMLADLELAGVKIETTQTHFEFGGHLSGSADAIVSNVPEAPKAHHVAEFKTHNEKSFNDLEKHGVVKAKPLHWIQMQVYMSGAGLDRALYVAVNKNDDRLHIERIHYDAAAAKAAIDRGRRVSEADRMPEPIAGASPAWYQCKFCPAYKYCHQTKITTEVNCRTCAHSTAQPDGYWHCTTWHDVIPVPAQRKGCDSHVMHPDLVPWEMIDSSDGVGMVWRIDGEVVANGDPETDPERVTSRDLLGRFNVPF